MPGIGVFCSYLACFSSIANGLPSAWLLRQMSQEEARMAKDRTNQGGPTHSPKQDPTPDRSHRHAASRDELKERSVKGERPGLGRRNGSDKASRG